jgi:hypothetical protein
MKFPVLASALAACGAIAFTATANAAPGQRRCAHRPLCRGRRRFSEGRRKPRQPELPSLAIINKANVNLGAAWLNRIEGPHHHRRQPEHSVVVDGVITNRTGAVVAGDGKTGATKWKPSRQGDPGATRAAVGNAWCSRTRVAAK